MSAADQEVELATFCPACHSGLVSGLRTIATVCPIPPEDRPGLGLINAFLNILCSSTVNGATTEYCYPVLKGFEEMGGEGAALTPAFFNNFCGPCVKIVFGILAEFDPEAVGQGLAVVDLLCIEDTKADGTKVWCTLELNETMSMPDGVPKVVKACESRCLSKLVNKARQYEVPELEKWNAGFEVICNRNPAGELCLSKVTDAIITHSLVENDPSNTCDALADPAACVGSPCQTSLQGFFDEAGCCAVNWLFLHCSQEANAAACDNLGTFVKDTCAVTSPDDFAPCAGFVDLVKNWFVWNIACPYYAANKPAIDRALLLDIAGSTGVEPRLIQLVVTCNSAPNGRRLLQGAIEGLNVQVTAEATSQAEADKINAELGTEGPEWFQVSKNTQAPEARSNSMYPAGEEPPEFTPEKEEPSAASSVSTGLFAVALCFLAALA